MLANDIAIKKDGVAFMPSEDEVKAKTIQRIQQKEKWHHATGKKTKGHGGS